jgi:hypothetical protein
MVAIGLWGYILHIPDDIRDGALGRSMNPLPGRCSLTLFRGKDLGIVRMRSGHQKLSLVQAH